MNGHVCVSVPVKEGEERTRYRISKEHGNYLLRVKILQKKNHKSLKRILTFFAYFETSGPTEKDKLVLRLKTEAYLRQNEKPSTVVTSYVIKCSPCSPNRLCGLLFWF